MSWDINLLHMNSSFLTILAIHNEIKRVHYDTDLPLKEVPLLAILTRNISLNFFASVHVNMRVQFLKKTCMLPTFEKSTFCKALYGKMMDHQYREIGATNIC